MTDMDSKFEDDGLALAADEHYTAEELSEFFAKKGIIITANTIEQIRISWKKDSE